VTAVVGIVGVIIVGVIPKWAIFAPIFVPLLMKLNVAPEVVLAAYRVADSPPNVITPLMPYFGLIVVFVQRYQQEAGVGTVVAMMLPYYVGVFAVWTLLLVSWFLLGLRLGQGEWSHGCFVMGMEIRRRSPLPAWAGSSRCPRWSVWWVHAGQRRPRRARPMPMDAVLNFTQPAS
jgi:hypothetical protein